MRKAFEVLLLLVLINRIGGAPVDKPVVIKSFENEKTDTSYYFS